MTTSKNVGELSFQTFLLQVVNGNYVPEHSQNISGCDPNYDLANSYLFEVAKKDITIKKHT